MKRLKQYGLPLLTLLLVVLGGGMPWLVGRVQDERMGTFQERFDLDTVSLTLRQDVGVSQALEVVSREYVSVAWGDKTQLTEQEAVDAAVEAIVQMSAYNLVPVSEAEWLASEPDWWAKPALMVAEDDSTALVWNCYWEASSCLVTVDDASGKAVRFLVENPSELVKGKNGTIQKQTDQWNLFFQDYYGPELTEELSLNIYEDHTSFNFR